MSYKATHWAWELELKMPEKFVLIALADMADEQQSCYPGQLTLSQMTGASESTVRRALKRLEDIGLLIREERRTKGGYRTSDRYVLQLDATTSDYRSDCPVGAEPTGQSDAAYRSDRPTSPVRVTGALKEEHPENHQGESPEPRKRGTRIPDPFYVTAEMWAWAAETVPGIDPAQHTHEFVDHFRAASGSNATKRDWIAAWRNWMRRAHRSTPSSQRTFAQQKQTNMLDLVGRIQEEEGRHAQVGSREAAGVLSLGRGA